MPDIVIIVMLVVLAYLAGSVSFAVLVSRCYGLPDPRAYGSGNPGATNVLRSGRKSAALLTLIGDAVKGLLPVLLTAHWAGDRLEWVTALSAVAAVLGHLYPVFHGFKGGKGVATALGALAGLSGYLALAVLSSWIVIAVFFRYSSLASMIAAASAVFYVVILFSPGHPFFPAVLILALLLIWRHRPNIRNLIAGTEKKIGTKASPQSSGV
jgi:glycerol-3-phosphate acyltransferase PlsY